MKFEPLEVTARLSSPLIAPLGLTLDSVLAYAAVVRELGADALRQVGPFIEPELPLERTSVNDGPWYYVASFAHARGFEFPFSITRQFSRQEIRVITSSTRQKRPGQGPMKDVQKPLYAFAPEGWLLTWYAVGDAAAVGDLLAEVHSLGKKRALGFGWVEEWSVSPQSDDRVNVAARLRRPVPIRESWPESRSRMKAFFGFRPPYWKTENQAVCLVPRNYGLERI